MPYGSSTPLRKISITWGRKETSVLLVSLVPMVPRRRRRTLLSLLLTSRLFFLPPGGLLALLAVHDQEYQRRDEADNHKTLQDAVV